MGSWNQGRFLELRQRGSHRLLAVAVTDVLPAALSAVYTFYDPGEAPRSLGTLGVLKQLEWAQRDRYAHLYLGYWIAGHPKMAYKQRFRPLQAFNGRDWGTFADPLSA
jgi:arginine-tRNA-protein transferase